MVDPATLVLTAWVAPNVQVHDVADAVLPALPFLNAQRLLFSIFLQRMSGAVKTPSKSTFGSGESPNAKSPMALNGTNLVAGSPPHVRIGQSTPQKSASCAPSHQGQSPPSPTAVPPNAATASLLAGIHPQFLLAAALMQQHAIASGMMMPPPQATASPVPAAHPKGSPAEMLSSTAAAVPPTLAAAHGTSILGNHPVYECICPTCQYYRTVMLMGGMAPPPPAADGKACVASMPRCSLSPGIDQYLMYQPMMYLPGMFSPGIPFPSSQPSVATSASPSQNRRSMGSAGSPTSNVSSTMTSPKQKGGVPHQAPTAATIKQTSEQFAAIQGDLLTHACTPHGRSLLQAVIRNKKPEELDIIFRAVLDNSEKLMLDQHSCHMVRLLVEYLEESQVAALVMRLDETLILNMSTLSQYTRRILQTLFEKHSKCDLQYVVDIMARNASYLAATQQGCISMMKVFERCSAAQKSHLVETLIPMLAGLACDQYGNYVAQHLFEHTEGSLAADYALRSCTGKFAKLACNKYASNVLEKLIRCGAPSVRRQILDEIVFADVVEQVAADGFGNFVIQTILDTVATPQEHKRLCDRLKTAITTSPFAHKIEAKMRAKRIATAQTPTLGAIAPNTFQRPTVAVKA